MSSEGQTPEPAFHRLLIDRIQAADLHLEVSSAAFVQLSLYYELLSKWNQRINLTALPLDGFPARTLDKLLVEPLAAAAFVDNDPADWLDLGSGGGSPALPLKIVRPALSLTMVEARSKKASFLREAVRELALEGASVEESRIEELPTRQSVDLITVRALKLDAPIVAAIHRLLRSEGRLLTFGGDASVEILPDFRVVNRCALPADVGELIVHEKT